MNDKHAVRISIAGYRFSMLSILTWTLVVALGLGWVLDRNRLNIRFSEQQREHDKVVDQMRLALLTLGEARELAFISREYARVTDTEFRNSLLHDQLRTVIYLFSIRNLVYAIDNYYADAAEAASGVLLPLGCKSAEDFVTIAKEQGYEEEDFLFTYEPRPGELEEFYSFLKHAIELPTATERP